MPAKILMCRPEYYGVHYEINPWMDTRRRVDQRCAMRQWTALTEMLEQAGATVELLPAARRVPDLVFTANAGMVFRDRVILSQFRHPQRQLEQPIDANWFAEHGYQVQRLPEDHFFEGAGDALFCGDTLYAGYRIRSEVKSHHRVAELIGVRVIPMELIDPYYYHLDTCFCPLAPDLALYYPGAFDAYGLRVLRESIPQLVEVEGREARHFACNAVVIGRVVITNTGCPNLRRQLRKLGFEPRQTPLSEFIKAGGSAKCLTLRLDGEEAAGWRVAATGNSPQPRSGVST